MYTVSGLVVIVVVIFQNLYINMLSIEDQICGRIIVT